jgi:hypothetical protein
MKSDKTEERPDCQSILDQQNEWVLNEEKVEFNDKVMKLLESDENKESYFYSIMKAKLGHKIYNYE